MMKENEKIREFDYINLKNKVTLSDQTWEPLQKNDSAT